MKFTIAFPANVAEQAFKWMSANATGAWEPVWSIDPAAQHAETALLIKFEKDADRFSLVDFLRGATND